MKSAKNKLNLTKGLFWEVDNQKLNWEEDKVYIIGRVLDMGTWDDIIMVFERYSEEEIKRSIVQFRELHRRTELLWSQYFKIPVESFSSWQRRETSQVKGPW
ncbi:MAG: hypothetical protein FVQ77_00935 [Cytophagales bacterium]|nr:hypothetical protein [Cytophagales bacterium]